MNHSVSFRGTAKEYFSIWIVNSMLKVITLSIYSAWAKVRKRRYLAEKLFIDDEPFEYLANPWALFRGWLIAAVAFLIYAGVNHFNPIWAFPLMLVILAFIPWVVVKSRIFNTRNHSFRNIRFGFAPKYKEAYRVMLGLPLLVPFTFGILLPYVYYRQRQFFVENTSYGATPFSFKADVGEFYKLFLLACIWLMGGLILAVIAIVICVVIELPKEVIVGVGVLFFVLVYMLMLTYIKTEMANLTWNSTGLGVLRFRSTMNTLTVFWLYLSGGIAVVLSLGLLFPWASVLLMRYRCERLTIISDEGIERFIADTAPSTAGAVGEEIGDLFGLDVDFGF